MFDHVLHDGECLIMQLSCYETCCWSCDGSMDHATVMNPTHESAATQTGSGSGRALAPAAAGGPAAEFSMFISTLQHSAVITEEVGREITARQVS
jgi:hypothetical protein